MAKVEMDLHELDVMREEIKKLKEENKKLEDLQKMVIIHHKAYKGTVKRGPNANNQAFNVQSISTSYLGFDPLSRMDKLMHNYDTNFVSFDQLIEGGFITVDMEEVRGETSRDYRNMEDVISEIRKESEAEVADRMKVLTKRAQDNAEKIAILEGQYEDKINALKLENERGIKDLVRQLENNDIKYNEEKETLIRDHENELEKKDEEYEKLQQEFNDFKENKKRVTLEEELHNLKQTLEETRAELALAKQKLPWWKK